MKQKIKVSAPGKLMLFGEHAILYNRPCLVAAISKRLFLEAEKISEKRILIEAPEVKISNFDIPLANLKSKPPKGIEFVLEAIKKFFKKYKVKSGLKIKTQSQFPVEYGLGSSAAATVCTIGALAEIFGIEVSKREIFNLAYATILKVQGLASGFDVGAAVFGGIIYFLTGGKIIERLEAKSLPLIVGYTGFKANTSEIVKQIKAAMEKDPEYYKQLYNEIARIVEKAKREIENSNWKNLGKLMNENQEILRRFRVPSLKYGVSSKIIENLIGACLRAGAFGAKLSGAGVGDCIVALGENQEKIERAIEKSGGLPLSVGIDHQGLKIEEKF